LSDDDSVASCHASAYFAVVRGKVKDDDDQEESVVTDDDGDQEVTQVDDQSCPLKTARDVTELTTYRRDCKSFSDDTRSPPSPIVTGSYKFHIGSSQNVFRRTRGGDRRPLRSAQGTTKVSAIAATLSTINATGQRSTYQVYFSVCR
jgi:hypothetical protein